MKKQILFATTVASLFCCAAVAFAGRAHAEPAPAIDVAFSPNGGAEQLVIRTIDSAQRSIRVMAYSFTSPAIVRALIAAQRRGVAVAVTVDYRNNLEEDRSGRARAALGSLAYQEMARRGQYFANLAERLNLTPAELDRHLIDHSISNTEHLTMLNFAPVDMFSQAA